MKSYKNQRMVLEAISDVKAELEAAADRGASVALEITPIMTRLGSLYACLNVTELTKIVRHAEVSDNVIQLAPRRLQKNLQKKAA